MPTPRIRSEYEQLTQIAQTFGEQANQISATIKQLQQQKNLLESGDWVGYGARAFYAEMNSQTLPALQKLRNALQAAQKVTGQITQVMKQAEEDAAACFRCDAGLAETFLSTGAAYTASVPPTPGPKPTPTPPPPDTSTSNTENEHQAARDKIKDNAQDIIAAAEAYGVDPKIVAGVIYAEQALNVSIVDSLTDWTGFYGVNTSIGLGQVRLETAKFLEEKGYITPTNANEGGWNIPFIGMVHGTEDMAREKRLENNATNAMYVAAYIKYFQDTWKKEYPNIANSPSILGSLYNLGHEQTEPNAKPQPNDFGSFVGDNYELMGELLGVP